MTGEKEIVCVNQTPPLTRQHSCCKLNGSLKNIKQQIKICKMCNHAKLHKLYWKASQLAIGTTNEAHFFSLKTKHSIHLIHLLKLNKWDLAKVFESSYYLRHSAWSVENSAESFPRFRFASGKDRGFSCAIIWSWTLHTCYLCVFFSL